MATQEEINTSMKHLLMMATKLLEEPDNGNNNFKLAQNLIRQCFFKYLDLKDCPFKKNCNDIYRESQTENHEPYGRDDLD